MEYEVKHIFDARKPVIPVFAEYLCVLNIIQHKRGLNDTLPVDTAQVRFDVMVQWLESCLDETDRLIEEERTERLYEFLTKKLSSSQGINQTTKLSHESDENSQSSWWTSLTRWLRDFFLGEGDDYIDPPGGDWDD